MKKIILIFNCLILFSCLLFVSTSQPENSNIRILWSFEGIIKEYDYNVETNQTLIIFTKGLGYRPIGTYLNGNHTLELGRYYVINEYSDGTYEYYFSYDETLSVTL